MNIIDKSIQSLPYLRGLFGDDDTQTVNNKFKIFSQSALDRDKQVQRLSVTNQFDHMMEYTAGAGKVNNMFYQQLMYNNSSDNKKRRIIDYRTMAQFPEVEAAIREICNEFFERDDQGQVIKCIMTGDYNDEIQEIIKDEFQKFLHIYKFNEKGWKAVRDWIIEGELFFENIVSAKKPELGILGTTRIAAERCDALYYDLDNELIDTYLLRAKEPDQYPYQWGKYSHQAAYGKNTQHQLIFMNSKQISYIPNDDWESEGKKYRVPILANAQRPYRQLSLIEDATIIYMLVRAPERLVFNIDTGTLPPAKQEAYLKRLIENFWQKKTIGSDGRVENTYDPQSMTENYWFPKPRDGQGSSVTSIKGGDGSPDNLEILNFFVQKLYKSLHVPLGRLNSDTTFADGENINREELTFAEFIISVQKIWAAAIKKNFITHLKLKGRKVMELANKFGVDEVEDPNEQLNSNDNSFGESKGKLQISKIFTDKFDFKCWDVYDKLCEAVSERVEEHLKDIRARRENLMIVQENLRKEIAILEEQKSGITVINEDSSFLLETIDNGIKALIEEEYKLTDDISFINSEEDNLESDSSSWWDQYELNEEDLDIKMNEPSQFFQIREQQLFQLRYDNFNNMSSNDMVSNTFAQKIYMGWTDKQILANIEFQRKDAALRWELSQIEQNGPNFREKALEELQSAMGGEGLENLGGLGGGGGGAGGLPTGGAGGGDTNLPEFGPALDSEGGEGEGGDAAGGAGSPPGGAPSGAPEGGGGAPKSPPGGAPKGESYNAWNKPFSLVENKLIYENFRDYDLADEYSELLSKTSNSQELI